MEKVVKAGWDDTKPVLVLNENELAVLMRTVVDEFEFPEYIVKRLDTYTSSISRERVFRYDEYELAEKYYNYLATELGN